MTLVILDRDGVINEDSEGYIKSSDEWMPIPGSIKAIADLHNNNFTVAVATNQSGLARGLFDLDALEAMHEKMLSLVEEQGGSIAGVFYCPHHPDENCSCRKPKTGLIDAIEKELHCDSRGAYFIGDSIKDLQAAKAKDCIPVLVKTGKGEKTLQAIHSADEWKNLLVFESLSQAAAYLIKKDHQDNA